MNETFLNPPSPMALHVATVSFLPSHSGDGYGYGGGAVVTIGGLSIPVGEGDYAAAVAQEIARRWNLAAPASSLASNSRGTDD